MSSTEISQSTLDDLVAELKSHADSKKDFWDRLAPASAFISSVVLGVAGLWFTKSYNDRQAQIAEVQSQRDQENKRHQARVLEMQAVEKFLPYLTADDERKKEVALLVITTLGSPEFATQFAKLNPSKGTQAAADRIMASATAAGPGSSPAVVAARTTTPSHARAVGWVYLGHFVAAERRWETRYFDFPASADPVSLVSTSLAVRTQTGSINVRAGMPTDAGEFLGVRQVLKPGSEVKVRAVREWSASGYMWAEIDFET